MTNKKFFYLLFGLVLISSLDYVVSGLRYVKYLIPFVCMLFFFCRGKNSFKLYNDDIVKPFLILIFFPGISLIKANTWGYYDFYFILCAVFPFLIFRDNNLNIRGVFFFLVMIYCVIALKQVKDLGFYYDPLGSRSTFEHSNFSFIFGLFTIYFFLVKDKLLFVFSLFMSFMVLKRISIIAIFLVIFFYYLRAILSINLVKSLPFMAMNFLFVFCVFFSTTDLFDSLTRSFFGMSATYFTFGRNVLYSSVFDVYFSDMSNVFFGMGFGQTYELASANGVSGGKENLHSDVAKILIENGLIVFMLFFFLLYRIKGVAVYLALYVNVVLITDNISTYTFVMFIYFFLVMSLKGFRFKEGRRKASG